MKIDHLVKWFGYGGRCVERFTVGCLCTISMLSVESTEIIKLVLKRSRKTQEYVKEQFSLMNF
jgi:hypothetical protein